MCPFVVCLYFSCLFVNTSYESFFLGIRLKKKLIVGNACTKHCMFCIKPIFYDSIVLSGENENGQYKIVACAYTFELYQYTMSIPSQ